MVARLRLLDALEVLVERLLRREGGAVDALEHRVALVAAPVRAGDLEQLHRADLPGVLHVRAAAEVDEVAVAEERDLLAFGDVVEARELELLAQRREERARLVAGHDLARERRGFSAMMRRISASMRSRSSGVKARSTWKSYWNFSQ